MTVPSEVRLERHTADIDDDGHHTGVAFSGDAVDVSIADAGSYFTATDVEAALQELASKDLGYTAHGALGSTETFSALVGAHSGTFSANCTFTFSGATSGLTASMILKLTSDGSSVATWPVSVVWAGGSAPTLSTTPGDDDILVFFSWDGGTTWYGGLWSGGGSSGPDLSAIDFLVGTASGDLSAEIVVGTTPGGQLAGTASTWPSPVITDAHGSTPSTHAATQAAAEATAAAALAAHVAAGGSSVTDHEHIVNVVFSGDASATVWELPAAPVDASSIAVYIAGSRSIAWVLSGTLLTTLTFDSAPASATNNIVIDIVAATA